MVLHNWLTKLSFTGLLRPFFQLRLCRCLLLLFKLDKLECFFLPAYLICSHVCRMWEAFDFLLCCSHINDLGKLVDFPHFSLRTVTRKRNLPILLLKDVCRDLKGLQRKRKRISGIFLSLIAQAVTCLKLFIIWSPNVLPKSELDLNCNEKLSWQESYYLFLLEVIELKGCKYRSGIVIVHRIILINLAQIEAVKIRINIKCTKCSIMQLRVQD